MVYNLYTIQDVMIGFNAPFIMKNDEIAKREYRNFLDGNKNSADMRLYRIGTFNDDTGEITPEVTPILIEGGN